METVLGATQLGVRRAARTVEIMLGAVQLGAKQTKVRRVAHKVDTVLGADLIVSSLTREVEIVLETVQIGVRRVVRTVDTVLGAAQIRVNSKASIQGFNCMYANADSLINKRSELQARIESNQPDIIAVTELLPKNLGRDIQQAELEIDGFDCFSTKLDERCMHIYKEVAESSCS